MDIDKQQKWNELSGLVSRCKKCALCKTRKNTVFGKGTPDAKIMFVGEAPGETEDSEGLPFVGSAGRLLDHYLKYFDFSLGNIYVTNILKCRPPKNRDPSEEEQDACIDFLRAQTRIIAPSIIVCLGRVAASRLIHPDFRMTAEHGRWFDKGNITMLATFHPSALLRDPGQKGAALADFRSIRQHYDILP